MTPVKADTFITRNVKYAKGLNAVFVNLVKLRSFSEKKIHLMLKAIYKYRKTQDSLLSILPTMVGRFNFHVSVHNVFKKINKLSMNKSPRAITFLQKA